MKTIPSLKLGEEGAMATKIARLQSRARPPSAFSTETSSHRSASLATIFFLSRAKRCLAKSVLSW